MVSQTRCFGSIKYVRWNVQFIHQKRCSFTQTLRIFSNLNMGKGNKSKTDKGVTCTKSGPSCKSSVSSFKDLDEVLKEYGMRERDRTRFMRATHQKVTSNIITSIKEASKDQSKYKLMSRMCEIQSNDDCRNVEAADFTNKLDLNYDQWIANKESNEEQFKKELADILQVDAFTIQIKDTKKGSVVIEWVYQIGFG
eukprot:453336_1